MFPRSLKGKLFVSLVLLGVLPFSLIIGIEAYWAHQRLMVQAKQRLASFPLPLIRRMENLLYTRWNDVLTMAHMPLFRQPLEPKYQTAILKRMANHYRPYALLAFADNKARIVAASDQRLVSADVRRAPWFVEARKITARDWREAARSIFISEPYVPGSGGGWLVMCFNSPVYDFKDRFTGVLHSEVKLNVLAPILKEIRMGSSGRVLLAREDGKVLLTDRGIVHSNASVAGNPAFRQAKKKGSAIAHGRDIEGDAALVGSFQLKGIGEYPGVKWFLVVSQKESEIHAPARNMMLFHSLMAFSGVALIFLGGFFLFDRNISKPVAQLIAGVSNLMERGPTPETEVVVRTEDEIGELARAFSSMVRNLAAQERTKRELQDQLIRKERLAAIGEMVAGVAHQIKNPLAVIKVTSQALSEDFPANASSKSALKRIDEEINRLNQLLRAFFDFAAPREPRKRQCDLRVLVQNALSRVAAELTQKEVLVSEIYSPNLPPLFVDSQQMLQVFINLFRNAIQSMEKGGNLSISTEVCAQGQGESARVRVFVSDTGIGIDPEVRDKIFRPFFTTRSSGTGLGLSLVYTVIQKHGGEIRVRSRPQKGSTFEFLLPTVEEEIDGKG